MNNGNLVQEQKNILGYYLDSDHWDLKTETGSDVGRDCIIELSEDGYWRNYKIEGQIRGTSRPEIRFRGKILSFSMDAATINYALG